MRNLILTACALLFSISLLQAQEFKLEKTKKNNKEKIHVKVKEGAEPDIYVDGKKFDFSMEKYESDKTLGKTKFKGESPVIIINGKVSSKEKLDKLSPNDIEKVEVFKDKSAIKKYNAPNGAIVITTKKGKKD